MLKPRVDPRESEPQRFELPTLLNLVVGELSPEPPPYRRAVNITTDRNLVSRAKGMAPRRHCRSCGKRLKTRPVVSADEKGRVYIREIAYGHADNGYWCSQKCIDRWHFN